MNLTDLIAQNRATLQAAEAQPVGSHQVAERSSGLPYFGFIDCEAAPGGGRFVMFSNNDDIVAKHYLLSGPHSFESETLSIWCHLARQSRWIFDVGAFTGAFSMAAAAANPNAIISAFEPSFVTYCRLLTNIHANQFNARIAPMRYGVGSERGELELRHPYGVYTLASGESFSESQIIDPWFTETVPIITIDTYLENQADLAKQRVIDTTIAGADLMKIDVEGFELEVLRGMQETVARHHPTIVMEILDSAEEPEVMALLGEGYSMLHFDDEAKTINRVSGGRNKLLLHESRANSLIHIPY